MSTEAAQAAVDKPAPPDPSVRKFARFFKTYGFSLGLVVAALPFGLQKTNFIDYYKSTGGALTFVASLVAYLCVAGVFGARQHIGQIVFRVRRTITPKEDIARIIYSTIIPGICGVLGIFFLIIYTIILNYSVGDVAINTSYLTDQEYPQQQISVHEAIINQAKARRDRKDGSPFHGRAEGQLLGKPGEDYRVVGQSTEVDLTPQENPIEETAIRLSKPAYRTILAETAPGGITGQFFLFGFYVAAFAAAAVSLVWFGVVEYLQAELGITDADLIRRPYRVSDPKAISRPPQQGSLGGLG
jgi:hypothetical protein